MASKTDIARAAWRAVREYWPQIKAGARRLLPYWRRYKASRLDRATPAERQARITRLFLVTVGLLITAATVVNLALR
ncbi:MAG: hypothetical protein H6961_09350 [Chromatiaceae bacterium]|nr:hypothetical protein [Chromatiaceae bacterium]MCP5436282.1 hypothetical protein [Chromatiaceae bacterium]